MLEKRFTLPQTQFSVFYRQQFFLLHYFSRFPIQQRHRSRIIAGVNSKEDSHYACPSSSVSRVFSSLPREIAPNTPLTNKESSSPPNFFANSTASLIETLSGIDSSNFISYSARRSTANETLEIRFFFPSGGMLLNQLIQFFYFFDGIFR